MHWYNHEHRHSGIRNVTPAERHDGRDHDVMRKRHALYLQALDHNPRRWSGDTRDCSRVECITLNPERDPAMAGDTAVWDRDMESLAK